MFLTTFSDHLGHFLMIDNHGLMNFQTVYLTTPDREIIYKGRGKNIAFKMYILTCEIPPPHYFVNAISCVLALTGIGTNYKGIVAQS